MKVTIITTFYKGNAYMERYVQMLCANKEHLQLTDTLEAIIVNDSPEVAVELPPEAAAIPIRVVSMEENSGIHAARVRGLKEADGDYVIFLDQDDTLVEDAVAILLHKMQLESSVEHSPVIVANAKIEQETEEVLWYRSSYHKRCVSDYKSYLRVGNQIISPGQCMLRRSEIPKSWCEHICHANGSDDYYLWLLFFAHGVRFCYLDAPLYVHHYTAQNLSADQKKMDVSTQEFMDYLKDDGTMPIEDLHLMGKVIAYKDAFRSGGFGEKLYQTLIHPRIFLWNVLFKLRSRTPYGFNRN